MPRPATTTLRSLRNAAPYPRARRPDRARAPVCGSRRPRSRAREDAEVAHFMLANGLEVVVIPDHRVPVVTHMVWYKVGSADEPPGKSGIAHFLEHLMFKGTEKNPGGKFSQVLATIGGQENAFTTSDYTGYYQRVAREYLPAGDGIRGRPHDRPRAHRRECPARARRRARGIQHARRQQPGRAARRAGRGGAVPQSSLRPAGDRLAARDREAQSRGRARLLPPLLHAQQRDRGRRRRRDGRRGARRWPRRPTARSRADREIGPRKRPQEPEHDRGAAGDAR